MPVATWVWQRDAVTDPGARSALLAFSRAKGVSSLYVAYRPEYDSDAGFAPLADLVRRAAVQGLRVAWVAGDPGWALGERHADARAVVDRVGRVNARLRDAGLERIETLEVDVEPYLLAGWAADAPRIEEQYLGMVAELHEAASRSSVALWMTVPFWFDKQVFHDTTLDRALLPRVEGLIVMAYRSSSVSSASKAEGILGHAEIAGRPVVVGVELQCSVASVSTWCGASSAEVDSGLRDLRGRVGRFGSFAGLAVHDYAAWTRLEGGAAAPLPR
jgi:hypothetical protein